MSEHEVNHWTDRCRICLESYHIFKECVDSGSTVWWHHSQMDRAWAMYREALANLLECLKS